MYREYAPSERLNRTVACYWTTTSSANPHRVLPDGCMDILLRRANENGAFRADIIGTMTTAIVVDEPPGTQYIGVRFVPGEAFRFLSFPAHEATNDVIPLGVAWGRTVRELEAKVSEARNIPARIAAIDDVLVRRLGSAAPADFRVRKTIAAVRAEGAIAHDLNIGSRHLRRLFETHVGISPRGLARVLRMQRVVSRINRGVPASWAALATDCGYFDQSHLVREFHALVGLSPTTFVKARAMSVSSNRAALLPAKRWA